MHINKKRLIKPEINLAEDRIPFTPAMKARLISIIKCMDRLYKGKIKRFTVYRIGPIQEK